MEGTKKRKENSFTNPLNIPVVLFLYILFWSKVERHFFYLTT